MNGAVYEGAYDDDVAVTRLATLFADGDRTLIDVAQSVDAIFSFRPETL